jgi:phage I-like protein
MADSAPQSAKESVKAPSEFLLIAAGNFDAKWANGDIRTYTLDPIGLASVLDDRRRRGTRCNIDYNHQGMSGGPAPAAGWCDIADRGGDLWAQNIEWTEAARKAIEAKEYAYFSPVIISDDQGRVVEIFSIALTNTPATLQQKPLIPLSSAGMALIGERKMDPVFVALLSALGQSTPAQLLGAVEALKASAQSAKESLTTALSAVDMLKSENKALSAKAESIEKEALVSGSKKISPAMRLWALSQSTDALKAFLAVAPDLLPGTEKQDQKSDSGNAKRLAELSAKTSWASLTSREKVDLYELDRPRYNSLLAADPSRK